MNTRQDKAARRLATPCLVGSDRIEDAAAIGDPANRRETDRQIARLALPALGALAAEPVYLLVDTAIVGHLGTTQLAGLALAGGLLGAVFWLFNFLLYGTTTQVARLRGAGDHARASEIAAQAFWLALAIGLALTVAGLALAEPAIALMGGDGAVAAKAVTYLRISALGAPFVMLAFAGQGYLRGIGDMNRPLKILVASNVANALLEVLFVYEFRWDIAGSAWGTVIAQGGAAAYFAAALLRGAATSNRARWPAMRRLLRLGGDLFVRTAALLVTLTASTALLAHTARSAAPVAAHQVAFQLFVFIAIVLDSLAIAAQVMIGHSLGAGRPAVARSLARRLVLWSLIAGSAIAVALIAGERQVQSTFSNDPAVADQLGRIWLLFALSQPFNAVVFALDGVLIGAGDTRFLKWAMLTATGAVALPLAVIAAALGWGILGIWVAITALLAVRLATNAARAAGNRWLVTGG